MALRNIPNRINTRTKEAIEANGRRKTININGMREVLQGDNKHELHLNAGAVLSIDGDVLEEGFGFTVINFNAADTVINLANILSANGHGGADSESSSDSISIRSGLKYDITATVFEATDVDARAVFLNYTIPSAPFLTDDKDKLSSIQADAEKNPERITVGQINTPDDTIVSVSANDIRDIVLNNASDPVLTQDITVAGISAIGNISDGHTFPEGRTLQELMSDIFIRRIAHNYIAPTVAVSAFIAIDIVGEEVGSSINETMTPVYIKNDGGNSTNVRYLVNGVVVGTTDFSDLAPHVISVANRDFGPSLSFIVEVDYLDGPDLPDNLGDVITDDPNAINAGTSISATTVFTGYYNSFYGAVDINDTIDSALIRSLSTSVDGAITLPTGSTQRRWVVALPDVVGSRTRSISSAVDASANNSSVEYVDMGAISVLDAGGTPRNYRMYELINAVPYSTSHNHILTIVG